MSVCAKGISSILFKVLHPALYSSPFPSSSPPPPLFARLLAITRVSNIYEWDASTDLDNQILHFWNLWVKGFQTVYRLSKSVDIFEEASMFNCLFQLLRNRSKNHNHQFHVITLPSYAVTLTECIVNRSNMSQMGFVVFNWLLAINATTHATFEEFFVKKSEKNVYIAKLKKNFFLTW